MRVAEASSEEDMIEVGRKDPETGDETCFLAFVSKYNNLQPADVWESWQNADVVMGHRAPLQRSTIPRRCSGSAEIEAQRREPQPTQRRSEQPVLNNQSTALALVAVQPVDPLVAVLKNDLVARIHEYSDDAGGPIYECLMSAKKKRKHDVRPALWRFIPPLI